MTSSKIAALAAALVTLSHDAAAEPSPGEAGPTPAESFRFLTPARCVTEGGSTVELAPGRYLPEPAWITLDTEVRRLQAVETRLVAENRSLRESARPRYGTTALVVGALVAGIAIGWRASDL